MRKAMTWAAVVLMAVAGMLATFLRLTGTPTRTPSVPLSLEPAPLRHIDVIAEYPHDPHALTQGLIYVSGFLYESTGRQGQSVVRCDLASLEPTSAFDWIDLSELLPRLNPPPRDVEGLGAYGKAVANGIAYDAVTGRLLVTGKNWPRLVEIRVRK